MFSLTAITNYLIKNCQVEVIVIVCNDNFAWTVNANADRVVGNSFASDLANKLTIIIENLKHGILLDIMNRWSTHLLLFSYGAHTSLFVRI